MNEQEILRKSILERAGKLKSVYGFAVKNAKTVAEEEAVLLLYYEEAYYESFRKHFGKELIDDVIRYNMMYNGKGMLRLKG